MVNPIEAELSKVTKLKGKPKEDRPVYLNRLVTAAGDLEDVEWKKISKPTQKWVNSVVKQYVNKGLAIPDFEVDDEAGDEPAPAPPAKAVAKKAGNGAGAAKKVAAKKVATKEDKAQRPLGTSAQTVIKRLLIKDPTLTPGDIAEKLVREGVSCSTVSISTIRSDFRHSLRVIQDVGKDVLAIDL